jgi:hypothetical protein
VVHLVTLLLLPTQALRCQPQTHWMCLLLLLLLWLQGKRPS